VHGRGGFGSPRSASIFSPTRAGGQRQHTNAPTACQHWLKCGAPSEERAASTLSRGISAAAPVQTSRKSPRSREAAVWVSNAAPSALWTSSASSSAAVVRQPLTYPSRRRRDDSLPYRVSCFLCRNLPILHKPAYDWTWRAGNGLITMRLSLLEKPPQVGDNSRIPVPMCQQLRSLERPGMRQAAIVCHDCSFTPRDQTLDLVHPHLPAELHVK
jgi:hypothetical protein